MRILGSGHALFAATLIGLGVYGLVTGHFGAIWGGVPKTLPGREVLIYLCAVVSLATGAGLFWRRTAAWAAGLILLLLLAWMLLATGRSIWTAPLSVGSWENPAETAVLVAAAWTLFSALADGDRRLGFAAGERGLAIGRAVFGVALVIFGLAHFAYLQLTAPLVPAWLPWHNFWAYFTGAAYIAAGLAVLARALPRLAASLAAVQIGLFTLLVWAPKLAAGSKDPSDWSEAVISWALTAGAIVVAESYRDRPWIAAPRGLNSTARARP
jgi:uncharacterized membrane protein